MKPGLDQSQVHRGSLMSYVTGFGHVGRGDGWLSISGGLEITEWVHARKLRGG